MGILPSLSFRRLELYRWWGCVLGCIFQAHRCRGKEMLPFLLVLAPNVLIAMPQFSSRDLSMLVSIVLLLLVVFKGKLSFFLYSYIFSPSFFIFILLYRWSVASRILVGERVSFTTILLKLTNWGKSSTSFAPKAFGRVLSWYLTIWLSVSWNLRLWLGDVWHLRLFGWVLLWHLRLWWVLCLAGCHLGTLGFIGL